MILILDERDSPRHALYNVTTEEWKDAAVPPHSDYLPVEETSSHTGHSVVGRVSTPSERWFWTQPDPASGFLIQGYAPGTGMSVRLGCELNGPAPKGFPSNRLSEGRAPLVAHPLGLFIQLDDYMAPPEMNVNYIVFAKWQSLPPLPSKANSLIGMGSNDPRRQSVVFMDDEYRPSHLIALDRAVLSHDPGTRRFVFGRSEGFPGGLRAVDLKRPANEWFTLPDPSAQYAVWRPGTNKLAFVSRNDAVFAWDAETGAVRQFPFERTVKHAATHIAYSPDGSKITIAHAKRILIFDAESLELECPEVEVKGRQWAPVWSPDSKLLAVGHGKGIKVLEGGCGAHREISSAQSVASFFWLPDSSGFLAVRRPHKLPADLIMGSVGAPEPRVLASNIEGFLEPTASVSPDGKRMLLSFDPVPGGERIHSLFEYDIASGELRDLQRPGVRAWFLPGATGAN